MSRPPPHVPVFIHILGYPMMSQTISKIKRILILMAVLFLLYLLFILKYTTKEKSGIERLEMMAAETEQQMANIVNLDEDLGIRIKIVQQIMEG